GAAATISRQHGITSATTHSAGTGAAIGWTSAPAANNTAAGAVSATRKADGFRRLLANACLPTASTIRSHQGVCHEVVTTPSQNGDGLGYPSRVPRGVAVGTGDSTSSL